MLAKSNCSPAVLYANARSRRGQQWFAEAVEYLRKEELELKEATLMRDPAKLDQAVEKAVKGGVPMVIVGGGDGTLSGVAKHFVGSDATLGILPLGTGNAFARDLMIPANLPAACSVISRGKTREVDLGFVQDKYFVNVVTVGLTARIATELTNEAKRRFGRAAYLFAMARALQRVEPFHVKITTPEQTLEFDTLQVVIGNGRFHAGPFPLAPDASITEGRLSGYALATTSKGSFFRLAWKLHAGRQCELPEVYAISTVGGRLETSPVRKVVVDGEIEGTTPFDFRVAPKAIRVRVPEEFEG
ncbi:MAG: hypothetical protein QOJ65_1406 [Fimbriimonadaceae bacterium]|nr:hypothetical protein [Fimbriimonadaceae bacterium]